MVLSMRPMPPGITPPMPPPPPPPHVAFAPGEKRERTAAAKRSRDSLRMTSGTIAPRSLLPSRRKAGSCNRAGTAAPGTLRKEFFDRVTQLTVGGQNDIYFSTFKTIRKTSGAHTDSAGRFAERRRKTLKRFLIAAILLIGISTAANAQATRTWVSGVGDDVNPCSRTAPCKTFAGAISKTASPGIINCLDPGGFGAVTITKSITIDCTGTYGSVLASGTQGIVVNALATDKIVLRGIDINGAGTTLGTNGVNIIQAGSVSLYDVNIANFSSRGIVATNTSNTIGVFVHHCEILNINGIGIAALSTGTGAVNLTVSNSHISTNGGDGIDIATATPTTAAVYDSV